MAVLLEEIRSIQGNALIKLSRYTLDRCSKVNEIMSNRIFEWRINK